MRKLYLARTFNVSGIAAKFDVKMDDKTIAQLAVNDEEVVDINEESHNLQFVPSSGFGPKSEPVLIPRGDSSYRVTMSLKNDLLKKTIVTEMIEVKDSPEKSIGSGSADSQTDAPKEPVEPSAADKLFGFVAGKVKEAQTADLRHKQAMENLEERFAGSELLGMLIVILKYASGLYEALENDEASQQIQREISRQVQLPWAFTQQGIDDDRHRALAIAENSFHILWDAYVTERTYQGRETVRKVYEYQKVVFSELGYAPLDKMEIDGVKLSKADVVLAFTNAFVKAFTRMFPKLESVSSPSREEYRWKIGGMEEGYGVTYWVPEKTLKSII